MAVVDSLYAGYGDGPPAGFGPDQMRLMSEGNSYLEKEFPKLDFIRTARLVESAPTATDSAATDSAASQRQRHRRRRREALGWAISRADRGAQRVVRDAQAIGRDRASRSSRDGARTLAAAAAVAPRPPAHSLPLARSRHSTAPNSTQRPTRRQRAPLERRGHGDRPRDARPARRPGAHRHRGLPHPAHAVRHACSWRAAACRRWGRSTSRAGRCAAARSTPAATARATSIAVTRTPTCTK